MRDVYGAITTSPQLESDPAFHNLSSIFADTEGLVFIDYCHTTETANARIASEMAARVLDGLPGPKPVDPNPADGDRGRGPNDVE